MRHRTAPKARCGSASVDPTDGLRSVDTVTSSAFFGRDL